jgi:hypothetical protein
LLSLPKHPDEIASHARWENVQAILYKAGGVGFVAGSVFFFPALGPYLNVGAWIYFWASILYLVVAGHDLAEVARYRRRQPSLSAVERLEGWAAAAYFGGTLLFMAGSLLFLPRIDLPRAGAWCFIVGSLLFVVGAFINVIQVPGKSRRGNLQLINLTAVTFVSGSLLFLVASVPYLWDPATARGERVLDAFAASQYLAGSLFFLAGGIANFRRAVLNQRRLRQGEEEPAGAEAATG